MEKIILKYDSASGQLTDSTGCIVGTWIGVQPFPQATSDSNKEALALALKYAGMSDDSVIKLIG